MAALQEALQCLTSTPRDEIPTDQASLRNYLTTLRSQARLIVDSVPEPPPEKSASTNSSSSSSSSKSKHKFKVTPSPARLLDQDSDTADSSETAAAAHQHQQAWSKPIIKPSHSKDNPLSIPVYKLQGSDGQGHWFGRRSIHEGLPYEIWEEKLSTEIAETLKRNQKRVEKGLPPDQAVRGIGAERVVEEVIVRDGDADANVMGKFTIYHVSATFPKPTTSRDFVAMIVTWENEYFKEHEKEGKWGREGRSWMMLSRPCEHPDAPPVGEYIRGQYESVEMIREIVVDRDGSEGSGSGSGSGSASKGADGESNPVEWIMVTRSDPGGTIPRWMVEKGTPKSICTDAAKFVGWASEDPEATKEKERLRSATKSENKESTNAEEESEPEESSDSDLSEYEQEEHHGLIASFGNLLNAGIERYAPQAVLGYIPHHSRESSYDIPGEFKDSDEDTTKHHQTKRQVDADADETQSQTSLKSETPTEPKTPAAGDVNLDITAAELLQKTGKSKLSSHERQLAKLAQEKRSVEAQLDLVRSDIESLGLRAPEDKDKEETKKETASARASADSGHQHQQRPGSPSSSTRAKRLGSDDRTSSSSNLRSRGEAPAPAADSPKMQKVASGLFREESKLVQKLSKIERQQLKEAAKIEARHRKDAEKQEKEAEKEAEKQDKARSRDENESLRRELEQTKKECEKLRSERKQWLGLIKSLQAENSKLAGQLGVEGEK